MKTFKQLLCLLLCICILACMELPVSAEKNEEQGRSPYQDEYAYINEEEILGTDELVEHIPSRTAEDYRTWAQADSRWGSLVMGTSGITIAREGCLVTSVTKLIIQCGLRDASSFNVGTFATWLNNNNGYSGNALYWNKPSECVSGFTNQGNLLSYGTYSSSGYNSQIISWINAGYHMTINVNSGGHWVAVDEAKSLATGQVYIMDSLSSGQNADVTLTSKYSTFNIIHAYKGGNTPHGGTNIGSDFYAFIIKHDSWKHLEAASDGNVRLAASGNDSSDPKQIWHFMLQSDGTYKIQNEFAGLCLDADNWGTENGTNVGDVADSGTTAQRWYVNNSGAGYAISPSYAANLVLDAESNSDEPGTNVWLYASNGTTAQIFSIYQLTSDGVKVSITASLKSQVLLHLPQYRI